mmetsp:Transcript_14271/g.30792  ORF Transcript_14271/g.30792 Transcript_14271/m.30792 type:complete len:500 (-) Transcript_14271:371-1870(-)
MRVRKLTSIVPGSVATTSAATTIIKTLMASIWTSEHQIIKLSSAFQAPPVIFPQLWMAKKRLTHTPISRSGSIYPIRTSSLPLLSSVKSSVGITTEEQQHQQTNNDNKNDDKTSEALIEWLNEMEGGLSSSVKIDDNGAGLRGLYATNDIRKGGTVVEIPYDYALQVGDSLWGTVYDDFTDIPGSDDWSEDDLDDVYQGLNFLQSFTNDADYGPYMDSLPQKPSSGDDAGLTPDFWCEESIRGIQIPSLIQQILDRKQMVKEVASKNNVNENALRWATWMMRSRRFTTWNMVPDPNYNSDEDDNSLFGVFPMRWNKIEQVQGYLTPLIDMANHANDPNAVMTINVNRWTREFDDSSSFALKALRPIGKGEEVTICYGEGDRTSLDLLDKYGFFIEGNNADDTIDWEELQPEFTTSLEEDEAGLAMFDNNNGEDDYGSDNTSESKKRSGEDTEGVDVMASGVEVQRKGLDSRRTMLSLRVLMKRLSNWKPKGKTSPSNGG